MRLKIANTVVAELHVDGVIAFDAQPNTASRTVQVNSRYAARFAAHRDRGNMTQTLSILVYREFPSAAAAERFALRHASIIGDLSGEGFEYLDNGGYRYIFPDGVLETVEVVDRTGCALTHRYSFKFGSIFRGWQIAIDDGGTLKIITITTTPDSTIIPLIEAN